MSISNNVLDTVRKTIDKHDMLNYGDTVVVGCSGGADSICLLHILNSMRDEYNLNIIAAHVNHKIRPGDAENDADFVKNFASSIGVEYRLLEVNIPEIAEKNGQGEEEAGRYARYDFFKSLAGTHGKIATAHNANDNVETVLMRLMRGTGLHGLSGIPYVRDGQIIRPILDIPRSDIEKYIEENGLTHITDKTNFEDIYTRNKIRLNLIPMITENFNPNFIATANANIASYKEDADFINSEAEKEFKASVSQEDGVYKVDIKMLSEMAPAISKRVIIKTIKALMGRQQIDVQPAKIAEIIDLIPCEPGSSIQLNRGYRARLSYGCIIFEEEAPKITEIHPAYIKLDDGNVRYIPELKQEIHINFVNSENIVNTPRTFYLPADAYNGKMMVVRNKEANDIYRVSDNIHKKLNRVFCDKKIDPTARANAIVFTVDDEVVCAMSMFATRFDKRSGRFIKIEICDV